MRDDFEAFYAELDRRYGLALVPRVRIGAVTAVTSPISCSLTLPGETTPRSSVPIVTPVVPAVGQLVRVELVADHPAVVDVLGGRVKLYKDDVATAQSTASTAYTDLTTAGPQVSVPLLAAGESVEVSVSYTGGNAAGAGHASIMSFAVSGMDSASPDDLDGAENDDSVSATVTRLGTYTAATTGLHTFTAKYKTIASGTSTFKNRRIIVRVG